MATNLPAKAPEWRGDIEGMAQEFTRSLPAQIPTERFVRTILTAMQINPDLSRADRRTLKMSCMRAAQDGLLPDGREGALVIYKTKVKRLNDKGLDVESWVDAVQWMPMVWGLLKKARNSGEIASLTGHVVYRHDKFRLVFGDEELLEHEPNRDVDDAECIEANAIGAYAIAKLKDGTIVRAWRSRAQIMRAKSQSKAANGPMWTKFWEEGWIKTAIRYLTKYLPSSTDKEGVDTFARAAERDDELYDFNRAKDVTPDGSAPASKLDRFVQTQHAAQDAQEPRQTPGDDPGPGTDAADTASPPDGPQKQDDSEMSEPAKKKLMRVVGLDGLALVTDSSTRNLLDSYRKAKAESEDPRAIAVLNIDLLRYLAEFASGKTLEALEAEIEAAEPAAQAGLV